MVTISTLSTTILADFDLFIVEYIPANESINQVAPICKHVKNGFCNFGSLISCTGLLFALLRYEKMFLEWIFIVDAVPPTSGLR